MPRNDWTIEERTTLWLLSTRFPLTRQEIANIINHIFAEDIKQCGFSNGMDTDNIHYEYQHRDKGRKPKMWKTICNADGEQLLDDSDENLTMINGLLDDIWEAAKVLEIGLAESDDVHATVFEDNQLLEAETGIKAAEILFRTNAVEGIYQEDIKMKSGGFDGRVYNMRFVLAHPMLCFSRINGEDPTRKKVAGGLYRRKRLTPA